MIGEVDTGDSTGGRKPTLLKITTGIPVVVGVDVTPRYTTGALADLAGQVLKKNTFPTSHDADFMTGRIVEEVQNHVLANKKHRLEVGISIPGVADQATGRVRNIPYFQWSKREITKKLF